jgi:hypothetical protein
VRLGPSPRGSDGYFTEIVTRVLSALPTSAKASVGKPQ